MKGLYLAPDAVPAPKGASSRIQATLSGLARLGHDVKAFTASQWAEQAAGEAAFEEPNYLRRMLAFRQAAARWLLGRQADWVQFRGIWDGAAALEWARRTGATAVFEAHGLPSIELPYHFPSLASSGAVLDKLQAEERRILAGADLIVTPSKTNARFLRMLGVPAAGIEVLPNGVDTELFTPPAEPPADAPPHRIVYQGTLAPWQGLDLLIEALGHLRHRRSLELHVVGPAKGAWRRTLRELARRVRVQELVRFSAPMERADLVPVLRTAHVCVAPLPEDPRNAVQGCCPIKILEYMAAGRPILSTAIAPVGELLVHGETAHLVRPGSPLAMAEGLAWLLDHPAEREKLGAQARRAAVERLSAKTFESGLARVSGRIASLRAARGARGAAAPCAGVE